MCMPWLVVVFRTVMNRISSLSLSHRIVQPLDVGLTRGFTGTRTPYDPARWFGKRLKVVG